MGTNLPAGDLARVVNHEMNSDWPWLLEISAYYTQTGRRGKRRSVTITADEWFGRNGHNSPITGERLLQIVEKLRKA